MSQDLTICIKEFYLEHNEDGVEVIRGPNEEAQEADDEKESKIYTQNHKNT